MNPVFRLSATAIPVISFLTFSTLAISHCALKQGDPEAAIHRANAAMLSAFATPVVSGLLWLAGQKWQDRISKSGNQYAVNGNIEKWVWEMNSEEIYDQFLPTRHRRADNGYYHYTKQTLIFNVIATSMLTAYWIKTLLTQPVLDTLMTVMCITAVIPAFLIYSNLKHTHLQVFGEPSNQTQTPHDKKTRNNWKINGLFSCICYQLSLRFHY